jgi:hypothetical protein
MNQDQKELLTKKIVQITTHIQRQIEERNDMVSGYNREIKECKTRVLCYAKAVESDSIEALEVIMGEFELAEFDKIGRS